MYTGTFIFMPAEKTWLYDPKQNLCRWFLETNQKTPCTLVWFCDDFCLSFTLQDFVGRMTKIEHRHWFETEYFVHSFFPNKTDTHGIEGIPFPYVHAPHTQNPHNPSLSRFEVFAHDQTLCSNSLHHNILTFLLHILIVLTCIQDNLTLTL